MEYGIVVLMVIGGILLYIKINELQKQVKSQQRQIDNLCKETGNQQLATYFISDEEKEYIATLSLGKSTDTYDASGTVLETKEFQGADHVEEALLSFLGAQKQMPPIYSAIKVNGKKLYEYARNGEDVHIEPRDIVIKDIQLLEQKDNIIRFQVKCSKGTYVRSICHDIGEYLNCGGHMSFLLRTSSGKFNLDNAITLEELEDVEKLAARLAQKRISCSVKI